MYQKIRCHITENRNQDFLQSENPSNLIQLLFRQVFRTQNSSLMEPRISLLPTQACFGKLWNNAEARKRNGNILKNILCWTEHDKL